MIKGIPIIAFDGTHSSGKTTLIYALAAKLQEIGINCAVLTEPTRNSPLVDDVVIRNKGCFDLLLEVDLIAAHISQTVRATRGYSVILSDRTPVSVIAYTKLLVKLQNEFEISFFTSIDELVKNWISIYDIVFYCNDFFNLNVDTDIMRSKVQEIQKEVDIQTKEEYRRFGLSLEHLPKNLTTAQRVDFIYNTLNNKYPFILNC